MSEPVSAALSAALSVLCDSRRRLDDEHPDGRLPDWVRARYAMERYYHGCGQILAQFQEVGDSPEQRAELGNLLRSLGADLGPYSEDAESFMAAHARTAAELAGLSKIHDGFRELMIFVEAGCDSPGEGLSLIATGRREIHTALRGGGGGDNGPDMGCGARIVDPPRSGVGREAKRFPPEGP